MKWYTVRKFGRFFGRSSSAARFQAREYDERQRQDLHATIKQISLLPLMLFRIAAPL
jgi:hypothetical protein